MAGAWQAKGPDSELETELERGVHVGEEVGEGVKVGEEGGVEAIIWGWHCTLFNLFYGGAHVIHLGVAHGVFRFSTLLLSQWKLN